MKNLIDTAWKTIAGVHGENVLVQSASGELFIVRAVFRSTRLGLDLSSGNAIETSDPYLEVREELHERSIEPGFIVGVRGINYLVASKTQDGNGNLRLDLQRCLNNNTAR